MPAGGAITAAALGIGGSLFSSIFGGINQGKATNQAVAGLNQGIGTLQAGQSSALGALSGTTNLAQGELTAGNQNATAALSPYTTAGSTAVGSLAAGLAPGGQFTQTLSPSEILAQNPGYQFQLQQGQQAIQRQASAQGTGISGGELKDLTTYSQGLAQNAYQQAFTNFNQVQNQNYSRLATLAGIGQTSAGQESSQAQQTGVGQAGLLQSLGTGEAGVDLNTASSISKLNDLVGATQAAGTLGQTNAITGGITGALSGAGKLTSLLSGLGGSTNLGNSGQLP